MNNRQIPPVIPVSLIPLLLALSVGPAVAESGATSDIPLPAEVALETETAAVDAAGQTMAATEATAATVPQPPPSPLILNDPLLQSYGSWGQSFQDQWGLYSSRLVQREPTLMVAVQVPEIPQKLQPVTVAVIDTGIDYTHPDLDHDNLWRNPDERANGRDDDGNGLIDDLIGWNFVGDTRAPWDDHGHGTHVAGIIAASTNNDAGIAGIAPNARLMILKALDSSGHGNGSQIATAIRYAVDKGARIIHLSLGGQAPGPQEQDAIRYALAQQTLIITAAGNQASGEGQGYESVPEVLVVGALTPEGQRAGFSDWGSGLDLLAPGVEILSLRARGSDFLRRSGREDYQPGSAVVDTDYYRATGNSFAAPFATGLAALMLGRDPWLQPHHLQRLLLQSARDLGPVGVDHNHGHGMIDMEAAMAADPQRYIEARLDAAELTAARQIALSGTADADQFARAWLEYGEGAAPQRWQPLAEPLGLPVRNRSLGSIDPDALPGGLITLRLTVQHRDGASRISLLQLQLPEKGQ